MHLRKISSAPHVALESLSFCNVRLSTVEIAKLKSTTRTARATTTFFRKKQFATCTSLIIHLVCPPKVCITFDFHNSWVLQPSQEKLKTMLMQNFGGQIRCIFWDVHVANRLRLATQQLCTCTMLFSKFLCRLCTTTTWKCLIKISRLLEDVNKWHQFSVSLPVLWYNPLRFINSCQKNSPKIWQSEWLGITAMKFATPWIHVFLAALASTTATAAKTSLLKWIHVF